MGAIGVVLTLLCKRCHMCPRRSFLAFDKRLSWLEGEWGIDGRVLKMPDDGLWEETREVGIVKERKRRRKTRRKKKEEGEKWAKAGSKKKEQEPRKVNHRSHTSHR